MTNYDALIAEKETLFNSITEAMEKKTEEYQQEMNELSYERFRLQGEYRILVQLKEESENPKEDEDMENVEADSFEVDIVNED